MSEPVPEPSAKSAGKRKVADDWEDRMPSSASHSNVSFIDSSGKRSRGSEADRLAGNVRKSSHIERFG